MATTDAVYRKNIARGIALLNKKKRCHWSALYLASLRIESNQFCVLGQLYGSFMIGLKRLGLDTQPATVIWRYGFLAMSQDDYWRVNRLWREAIEDERKQHNTLDQMEV